MLFYEVDEKVQQLAGQFPDVAVPGLGGHPENIVMRIWERGSGETMASGSGSCGAALASMITERTSRKINVHLVYGTLKIEWSEDGDVYQEGPATEVYTGVWPTNGHAG